MQTFLPYPSFTKSAKSLDNKRLNKQIVECYQILKAINGETKGWKNHPAVLMWKGYENALVCYGLWCCWEWEERGFKTPKLKDILNTLFTDSPVHLPWWFGLYKFHESHRSNLYRKDSEFYRDFKYDGNGSLPYCWPVIIDNQKYLRYKHIGEKKYVVERY